MVGLGREPDEFLSLLRASLFDDAIHSSHYLEENECTPVLFQSDLDPARRARTGSDACDKKKSLCFSGFDTTNNANMGPVFQAV